MSEDEAIERAADAMFNDQNVNDNELQAAGPRIQRERAYLFGQIRLRRNNNIDLCCFHNLSKGFLWMLFFASFFLVLLLLYAAFA